MRVQSTQRAVIFTSALKLETIVKASKVCPELLKLKNEKDEVIFVISAGNTPGITAYGATFQDVDADGYACITALFNTVATKDAIIEKVGAALLKLQKLEDQIEANLETYLGSFDAMFDGVTAPANTANTEVGDDE